MSKPSASTLRIIGGQWKRRNVRFLAVDDLRPTPDHVRETVFNWLQFDIQGKRCLDAFAGSGALGLEALSRGAASCLFLEKSAVQARQLQATLNELGAANADIRTGDSLTLLARVTESTKRRRRILMLVQDALSQLRLDMKYLVFDLEATHRERDDYRQRLKQHGEFGGETGESGEAEGGNFDGGNDYSE